MNAKRSEEINGHIVEEFKWNNKLVVCIDNKMTGKSFDLACKHLREEEHEFNIKEQ